MEFSGPDGRETVIDRSHLKSKRAEINSVSSSDRSLAPGDGSAVTLRLVFSEDSPLQDLVSKYSEITVPWSVHVTEGARDYAVNGTAVVKTPSGVAEFPKPRP